MLKIKDNNEVFGGDFFVPMILILIKTFFTTWPFVSDEKYMENFVDNFIKVSEEVFDKYI